MAAARHYIIPIPGTLSMSASARPCGARSSFGSSGSTSWLTGRPAPVIRWPGWSAFEPVGREHQDVSVVWCTHGARARRLSSRFLSRRSPSAPVRLGEAEGRREAGEVRLGVAGEGQVTVEVSSRFRPQLDQISTRLSSGAEKLDRDLDFWLGSMPPGRSPCRWSRAAPRSCRTARTESRKAATRRKGESRGAGKATGGWCATRPLRRRAAHRRQPRERRSAATQSLHPPRRVPVPTRTAASRRPPGRPTPAAA